MAKYLFLLFLLPLSTFGQTFIPDTLSIQKTWKDKNGRNTLTIVVNGSCNQDNFFFGPPSEIKVSLKKDKRNLDISYVEKDHEMSMILFDENHIWHSDLNKIRATFIPFTYCANSDSQVLLSYILVYDNMKFLFHFKYYCTEEENCTLVEKGLQKQLRKVPVQLKNVLMKKLREEYNTLDKFN